MHCDVRYFSYYQIPSSRLPEASKCLLNVATAYSLSLSRHSAQTAGTFPLVAHAYHHSLLNRRHYRPVILQVEGVTIPFGRIDLQTAWTRPRMLLVLDYPCSHAFMPPSCGEMSGSHHCFPPLLPFL